VFIILSFFQRRTHHPRGVGHRDGGRDVRAKVHDPQEPIRAAAAGQTKPQSLQQVGIFDLATLSIKGKLA
jgi:hypothetical protein